MNAYSARGMGGWRDRHQMKWNAVLSTQCFTAPHNTVLYNTVLYNACTLSPRSSATLATLICERSVKPPPPHRAPCRSYIPITLSQVNVFAQQCRKLQVASRKSHAIRRGDLHVLTELLLGGLDRKRKGSERSKKGDNPEEGKRGALVAAPYQIHRHVWARHTPQA